MEEIEEFLNKMIDEEIIELKDNGLQFVKRSFFIEDMIKAFNAGGDIKSWSDFGFEPRYENFEDWYRKTYGTEI